MEEFIKGILTSHLFLWIWGMLVIASVYVLIKDLRNKNSHLAPLMKWVWLLTVAYSGPLGLLIYFYSGRKEIKNDSLWRRSFRSVAHCYSGCGAGEITGVLIAAGILSLGNWLIAGITFTLAYVAGFSLTVGPLMQGGVGFGQALKDAFITETPSITIMELVAISTDLYLAGGAGISEILFWSSLVFSLTMGLIAAYPVNVILIRMGVKEGMMDPRMTEHS